MPDDELNEMARQVLDRARPDQRTADLAITADLAATGQEHK